MEKQATKRPSRMDRTVSQFMPSGEDARIIVAYVLGQPAKDIASFLSIEPIDVRIRLKRYQVTRKGPLPRHIKALIKAAEPID